MDSRPETPYEKSEKPYVTSLTLGGFQVFDQPTTIPLGKLTFLFGPNSAGKSAIEDGLKIVLDTLRDDMSFDDLISDDIRRHWRVSGGKPAPVLTMGITAIINYQKIVRAFFSRRNELPGNGADSGVEVGLRKLCTSDRHTA